MHYTVAFQGEKGAFSEAAALAYWGNHIKLNPCHTFKDVFQLLQNKTVDHGIIPIENSLTGSIHQNIDLALDFHHFIVGEIILRIQHNLLVNKGVKLEDIKTIVSHPQALMQCSNFLESLKDVECLPMYDTAGSAQYISEHKPTDKAAIASLQAGKDYGLQILKKDIENNKQNYTRFLIISKTQTFPQKNPKTSVVFSTKDIPGALFKALSVFALRDINLLKIESRPWQKGPWKYWFYLDFEGSMQDEVCKRAIGHLEEITAFLKILGSYSKGRIIE